MLKEFKNIDIDTIMNLWKQQFLKNNKIQKNEELTEEYSEVRNKLLDKNNTTIEYTEDGKIYGFVSVDRNGNLWLIYVKEEIRREGIGSILISNCKKRYKTLRTDLHIKNKINECFFENNGFSQINIDNNSIYEWNSKEHEKVNLIYFDNDLDKRLQPKDSKINIKNINIKSILNNSNERLNNIKTYIKIRRCLEENFKGNKIIMYIDYNNYYSQLNDLIKEIVKIRKIDFALIVCEPFIIESSKKEKNLSEIEENFKEYKIFKIDSVLDMEKDISVNQIFEKRMEIVLQKIEKIAENM